MKQNKKKKRITVGADIRFFKERCSNLSYLPTKILLHSFREGNDFLILVNCVELQKTAERKVSRMIIFIVFGSFLPVMAGGYHYGNN